MATGVPHLAAPVRARLLAALAEGHPRHRSGPGAAALEEQIDHALALATCVGGEPERFLDLGSGAGLPGLVLASCWGDARGVLLEASTRRASLLRLSVHRLELASRVEVLEGRAEDLAHEPEWREQLDLVIARAFGPPPATAECGAGFLAIGGRLVVSEPPGPAAGRWPATELARLGLDPASERSVGSAHAAVMTKVHPMEGQWPRRTGIPARRPLWR